MVDNDSTGKGRRERKGRSTNTLVYILVILAMAGGIYLYLLYLEKSPVPPPGQQTAGDSASSTEDAAVPPSSPSPAETESVGADQGITTAGTHADLSTGSSQPDQAADQDEMPKEKGPDSAPETNRSCTSQLKTITDFYRHLDQQEYLEPYQLGQPAEIYFSTLIQKVADNPPIVTGETDDLFNILKNTAHFFRIFGKKNIFVLKAILDREKDSFEKVLAEFYQLTYHPECLEDGFSLSIPQEALYDYAGFFLNTMGGRLYLFRRDSVSRMAVSFYSILIVDHANTTGTNKHGIDIVPAIEMLIPELENSGSQLRLRDQYLDALYDLKEKYM